MNWLLARLREGSTWRGLVWLLAFAGVSLKPEQAEAIIAAGMALAGLLGVFLQDRARPTTERTRETDLPPIDLQGRATSELASDRGLRLDVPPEHCPQPDPDRHGWGG